MATRALSHVRGPQGRLLYRGNDCPEVIQMTTSLRSCVLAGVALARRHSWVREARKIRLRQHRRFPPTSCLCTAVRREVWLARRSTMKRMGIASDHVPPHTAEALPSKHVYSCTLLRLVRRSTRTAVQRYSSGMSWRRIYGRFVQL